MINLLSLMEWCSRGRLLHFARNDTVYPGSGQRTEENRAGTKQVIVRCRSIPKKNAIAI